MRRTAFVVGISLGLAAAAGDADAQEPPTPAAAPAAPPAPSAPLADAPSAPPRAPDRARARALHATGKRFYLQGDYVSALEAFEQAYTAEARPNLLFAQANTHKKLFYATGLATHRERAIAMYRSFLATAPPSELTVDATTSLEALGPAQPPRATLDGPPAPAPAPEPKRSSTALAVDSSAEGAQISIDGGPAGKPPLRAEVAPGRHVVRVTAPGFAPREVAVVAIADQITPERVDLVELDGVVLVTGDDDLEVFVDGISRARQRSFRLRPGHHFVAATTRGHESFGRSISVARGSSQTVAIDVERTSQRTLAYALLGVGGAGVVAGAVTLGLAADRDARAKALDDQRTTSFLTSVELDKYRELSGERDTFRTAGVVTTVGGAAASAVGLFLFFADERDPPAPPDAGPASDPGRADPSPDLVLAPSFGPHLGGLCARGTF